jgi:hypothetical protein
MKKASEILREAASEVDAHWGRGAYVQSGRVCAMGAIHKSMWGEPGPLSKILDSREQYLCDVVTDMLARVFTEQGFSSSITDNSRDHIIYVNDHLAKSRKDISSCMEKAAAQLEERGQ